MNTNLASQLGSFAFFGFTQSRDNLQRWAERLGITPSVVEFGDWGYLFFHTSYGDVEETKECIALKLGFIRSPDGSPLSTRELVHHKTVTPQTIDHRAARGNGLLACLGKTEGSFSVYQTLLSAYQLHYTASDGDILCSDSLRCLVAALGHVEMNEDLLPYHFGLLYLPGRFTFLRGIHRLLPGEMLQWKEGNLNVQVAQDLRFSGDGSGRFDQADDSTTAFVYERLGDVLGSYIEAAEASGGVGSFLSGGIDSSLLQLIINERSSQAPRSFTYAPTQAPNFEFEVAYARQASEVFGTEHTFVEIGPEDFSDLLIEATDILAQPVITDPEPNKLGLAKYLAENVDDLQFFVNGLAAGTLFGGEQAKKLKILEMMSRLPLSRHVLGAAGSLLRPFTPKAQTLLRAATFLGEGDDPASFANPINTKQTALAWTDLPRQVFGDEAILKALQYRRGLEAEYLGSHYTIEKAYVVSLLTFVYEVQVQSQRLFLSQNVEQIYPFMDEDIVRLAFAFRPEVRYVAHLTYKYPFRKILAQRSSSTIGKGGKRKGGSLVLEDLFTWMQSGPMQDRVREIELPGFMSRKDFEQLVEQPNMFLWSLLTFDVFQKRVLKS